MNEPWNKKKKFFNNDSFGDIFDFNKLDDLMDSLMEDMIEERDGFSDKKPLVMGFSFKVGPDGKPLIEGFGNIKREQDKAFIADAREPLVDVIDQGESYTITGELPGVEKKDVNLSTEKKKLIISVKGTKSFYKEIDLSQEIIPETAKASMKNGVLEITLKKAEQKLRGHQIKID